MTLSSIFDAIWAELLSLAVRCAQMKLPWLSIRMSSPAWDARPLQKNWTALTEGNMTKADTRNSLRCYIEHCAAFFLIYLFIVLRSCKCICNGIWLVEWLAIVFPVTILSTLNSTKWLCLCGGCTFQTTARKHPYPAKTACIPLKRLSEGFLILAVGIYSQSVPEALVRADSDVAH